jgi:hypothetical protein
MSVFLADKPAGRDISTVAPEMDGCLSNVKMAALRAAVRNVMSSGCRVWPFFLWMETDCRVASAGSI